MAANVVLYSTVYDSNASSGFASVLIQGANATFQISANSTGGNSTIGNPSAADFILGATISDVFWSTDSGAISILRGANTVLGLAGSGNWGASNGWQGMELYPGATLVVNVPSGNSTVMIKLKKRYS